MPSNQVLFHFGNLFMQLSNNLIPLNIETVHFFDMGLFYLHELMLMPFTNFFDLPLFGELLECLYLAFTAFGFNILPSVLVLLLL